MRIDITFWNKKNPTTFRNATYSIFPVLSVTFFFLWFLGSRNAWSSEPDIAASLRLDQTKLTADDAEALDVFGRSVSLFGDVILIGAPGDDVDGVRSGSVYVFMRNASVWTQVAKLRANDASSGDLFGHSVSLSGDTALIGAYRNDENEVGSGSAYIFEYSDFKWTQQEKLMADDAASEDWFGYSVSISGDTALIAAYSDDDSGTDSGSVYVFTRSGSVWTQQAKLTPTDLSAGDRFGQSVSLFHDTALIGAPSDDDNGTDSGSSYVFTRNGSVWKQQAKLISPHAQKLDIFGNSVSIFGDTALVGVAWDDRGGGNSGAAEVFTRTGSFWKWQYSLRPDDPATSDAFGNSVSLYENTALISTRNASAYVFSRSGVIWTQQMKFADTGATSQRSFGCSVSLYDDTVLIGADNDDNNGSRSGSSYVSTLSLDGNEKYQLIVSADHGTVQKSPDLTTYDEGSVVTLIPIPKTGYFFTRWMGDVPKGHETDSPLLVTVDKSKSITTIFAYETIPLTLTGVEDVGEGNVSIEWIEVATSPRQRYLGLSYDSYTSSWADRAADNSVWFPFSASERNGTMYLKYTGAYFSWIYRQELDGSLNPGLNPGVYTLYSGTPHKPINVSAIATGNDVNLKWKTDQHGTWLYWIIAYHIDSGRYVSIRGPLGESVWHYVLYGTSDFTAGSTELTMPSSGQYWVFLAGMAWDGKTRGDFEAVLVSVP